MIPREFIHEILSRCDVVDLIDARVPLRKKGNNFVACCPFHQEKTPSFSVSRVKQIYHCFGCGAGGNAISFVMEYDRLSFVEAIEEIAKSLGIAVPQSATSIPSKTSISPDLYQLMEQAARFYQMKLRENPAAIEYLKNRGLSGEIAKKFALGYALPTWDSLYQRLNSESNVTASLLTVGLIGKNSDGQIYDRFRDRITFPIRDARGRVLGFGGRILHQGEPKYLNSPETPIFHKGRTLYGLWEAQQVQRDFPWMLVVEGYMDVVALAQHGIHSVVATMGTAITPEHIQRLFRLTQEVIFCFDGDSAGQTAAWRALDTALPYLEDGLQIKFLLLPRQDDPDTLVRREGAESFRQRILESQPLADFLFQHLLQSANINTTEGSAKLGKQAVTYLNKLPEGILKHMLFERLAKLVRIDVGTLKNLTQKSYKERPKMEVKKSHKSLNRSPMRFAIALLLQHPTLAQSVSENFSPMDLAGSEILMELITILKNEPNLTTASLLENWRDRPEQKQLQQLSTWELNVPSQGLDQELLGCLEKLIQLDTEKQAETLLNEASKRALTEVEKKRLQNLIVSVKK